MMKSSSSLLILLGVMTLLGTAKSAAANGGHLHLGGIFFLLLGGLVFVVGIGVVFYLLLRPSADASDPDDDGEYDEDNDHYA